MFIHVFAPEGTVRLREGSIPDATVGEPYYYKFHADVTGNSDRSMIRFGGSRGGYIVGID